MSPSASETPAGLDFGRVEAISAAVEAGAGLPEVVRAAARALESSLALIDRSSGVLAVAGRSPTDERALTTGAAGVETVELSLAGESVGELRVRPRATPPPPALVRLVATVLASELARVRAPEKTAEAATAGFVQAVLRRDVTDRETLLARGRELGIELAAGASVIVVHAQPRTAIEDGWRGQLHGLAGRAARAVAPGALAVLVETDDSPGVDLLLVVPGDDDATARRAAEAVLRELDSGLGGVRLAIGRSRVAQDPLDLKRAGQEAQLAANVASASGESHILAYEETGAYRLLLPAMSEQPEELQRFYAETLEPLVGYDEQYETELVRTLETFLEADGSVAGTAQTLFTHRHTIRYRLERVRELTGLDVGSTEGREKLGLGLKAMRVLGITAPRGPATEAGAEAGRVPREPKDR